MNNVNLGETLDPKFTEEDQIIKQLAFILQSEYHYQLSYEFSHKAYHLFSGSKTESALNMQHQVVLKFAQNMQISVQIFGVGKIVKSDCVYRNFVEHARIFNRKNMQKNYNVFWVQKNQNYCIREYLIVETLDHERKALNLHSYFKDIVQKLLVDLSECILQIDHRLNNYSLQKEGRQNNISKVNLNKNFRILDMLKFQFEKNRIKNRVKSTKNYNFYTSPYENLVELLEYKQYRYKKIQSGKSWEQKKQIRNSFTQQQAHRQYENLLIKFNERQTQKMTPILHETKKQILSAIRLHSIVKVNEPNLQSTFSQIHVVEADYDVIFSVNLQTNKNIDEQNPQSSSIKRQKNLLVMKKKWEQGNGCERRVRQNQLVFETEKQMLIILKSFYHVSICNFFVKQYETKQQIDCIYSQRLPSNPIQKFCQSVNGNDALRQTFFLIKFFMQVSQGIYFLSSHKVIHRDIKPMNVMLDKQKQAKIIDFGSASPIFGVPHNISPELYSKLRSSYSYFNPYKSLVPIIKQLFTKQQYDQHESFDVFSIGAMAEVMLNYNSLLSTLRQQGSFYLELVENIEYLIKKCKDVQPDDRFTPLQAVLFFAFIGSCVQSLIKQAKRE